MGLICALDRTGDEHELREQAARQLHQIVGGMNLANFVIKPNREWVQRYSVWENWSTLSMQEAGDVAAHLAGLPSAVRDDDEEAKRFDLLLLRTQLATLDADHLTVERLRPQVQAIAGALLSQTASPAVAAQQSLLADVAEDEWWIDVTLAEAPQGRGGVMTRPSQRPDVHRG